MGSDLYMESQSFRPRPDKVTWVDSETVRYERDYFYDGYKVVYEGKVTPQVEQLLLGLGVHLPAKPTDADDPLKVLAEALHEAKCTWNHTDGCAWFYETNDKQEWTQNRWTQEGRAHKRWLDKAREARKLLPEMSVEDIIKVAKVL